jgi:hypothetical protein
MSKLLSEYDRVRSFARSCGPVHGTRFAERYGLFHESNLSCRPAMVVRFVGGTTPVQIKSPECALEQRLIHPLPNERYWPSSRVGSHSRLVPCVRNIRFRRNRTGGDAFCPEPPFSPRLPRIDHIPAGRLGIDEGLRAAAATSRRCRTVHRRLRSFPCTAPLCRGCKPPRCWRANPRCARRISTDRIALFLAPLVHVGA